MATKKKTDLIPGLKDSAYDIWLAGLGAFSLAGEEGSRLGHGCILRPEALGCPGGSRDNLGSLSSTGVGGSGFSGSVPCKVQSPRGAVGFPWARGIGPNGA